ncbi:Hexose phosphate transport protein UhpT [Klebsiella michiganensis]|nr:Hexose phosphate transport protein UhpT [Klebsiella michiganensis]
MFIFPSIIALIVGFIGLRFGSDSPESYGLGNAEELFGEEISEEDKETEENAMTKWQIFVEYVLKNKVIWLLCFSNIFLYVVRIGIDQWSTVYAFQELKLSKEVAIQGFTLFESGRAGRHAAVGLAVGSGKRSSRAGGLRCAGVDYRHPGGLSARQ